jgi:hypothetical protein
LRVQLHALVERCSRHSADVIAKSFAALGGRAELLEFLLNLA